MISLRADSNDPSSMTKVTVVITLDRQLLSTREFSNLSDVFTVQPWFVLRADSTNGSHVKPYD